MRRCERGFTFLEAVIALFILSILVMGSVTIAGKGVGGLNLKQDRQTAFRIAESIQDELLGVSLGNSMLAAGYSGTRYYDVQGNRVATATDPATLFKASLATTAETKAVAAIGGPFTQKKVSIEISWDTNHRNPSSGISNPDKVTTAVWR